jgi:hypothetical protein
VSARRFFSGTRHGLLPQRLPRAPFASLSRMEITGKSLILLAVPRGLEPPTFGLGNRRSIRLSYGTAVKSNVSRSAGSVFDFSCNAETSPSRQESQISHVRCPSKPGGARCHRSSNGLASGGHGGRKGHGPRDLEDLQAPSNRLSHQISARVVRRHRSIRLNCVMVLVINSVPAPGSEK